MSQSNPTLSFTSLADLYEAVLVAPLFRPWVDDLLARVQLTAGDHVLDVACGTGIVARTVRERLGPQARIVGLDASPNMLSVAARVAPDIEWREGNAVALPFDAGAFDVVVSQQGLQFFPDKPAAAREMRRVLVEGGRIGVATWLPLDENPLFRDAHAIAERHLGPIVDQRHNFGVAADLEALLKDAGFADVRVETVTRTIHFTDPASFFQMNTKALVGMSPSAKMMDEAEQARIASLITTETSQLADRYRDAGGLAFALSTNLASGRV